MFSFCLDSYSFLQISLLISESICVYVDRKEHFFLLLLIRANIIARVFWICSFCNLCWFHNFDWSVLQPSSGVDFFFLLIQSRMLKMSKSRSVYALFQHVHYTVFCNLYARIISYLYKTEFFSFLLIWLSIRILRCTKIFYSR